MKTSKFIVYYMIPSTISVSCKRKSMSSSTNQNSSTLIFLFLQKRQHGSYQFLPWKFSYSRRWICLQKISACTKMKCTTAYTSIFADNLWSWLAWRAWMQDRLLHHHLSSSSTDRFLLFFPHLLAVAGVVKRVRLLTLEPQLQLQVNTLVFGCSRAQPVPS